MAKKPTEWGIQYLNQQYSAMRWLAKQGLTPEQIRVMRWGAVDETDRSIRIDTNFFYVKYDKKTDIAKVDTGEREIHISLKGSGHEWFFMESKIACAWMFTARPPKTWRKQGSIEALFPLEVVENCCRDLALNPSISGLTELENFGNIRVSKADITKLKTSELMEAEVVRTGAID